MNNKFNKTLIIACGALSHEILTLIRINQWAHLDLTCLPANYHHTPDKIPAALQKKIQQNKTQYAHIYVAYGDCGTAGKIDKILEEENVKRIAGPHCFSFLSGNTQYEEWTENQITCFYLTDFFCKHFENFMWKALGLDRRDDLADFVFGNYEKLVFVAQTSNPLFQAKAREIAARLNLEYEYRFTGYGDLTTGLAQIPVHMN